MNNETTIELTGIIVKELQTLCKTLDKIPKLSEDELQIAEN
ncbi:hypothetical protein C8R34_101145 [Nitrosomonas sp. Nm84]|nr:hypothetical protein [Nitrosomonas sp. Nm84]PXW91236.1 hypothetical protein C8R34_101145 [Nitrosomonas sp. Nm84]